MSDTVLTTGWEAALERTSWLDEALARREWRRTVRQLRSGRWPVLFTLLVMALWLPALTTASYAGSTVVNWRWPFASLLIAICLCGIGAAFMRGSQVWTGEARVHTLESWLLSLQRAEALAVTAVLSAVVPVVLISLPALAILLLVAAQVGVGLGVVIGVLLVYTVLIVMAAACGSGFFFLQVKAYGQRTALAGGLALATLVLALWLRIEYVESGWAGPWERHPGRLTFAFLLATPVPHLFGLSSPEWWNTTAVPRLGFPVSAAVTTGLLALLYLGLAAYGLALSVQGFRLLRADPERLEARPELADEGIEAGEEFYWTGFRNPIWTREIRTRLRSREAVECTFFASIAIAAAGFLPLLTAASQLSDPLQAAEVARQVFFWLSLTLVAFVTLITPGLTAEAITLEREHGTLDLLLSSPMRPGEILNGKLLGAFSILALLLSPSLPLFGMCTVFHGASVAQVLGVYLVLGFSLLVCAYFGVTASAIHPQMVYAKFQAYFLAILFSMGPGGFFWIIRDMASPSHTGEPALGIAAVGLAMLCCIVMAIVWGHATERLQYAESDAA